MKRLPASQPVIANRFFGNQEPGTAGEIRKFCNTSFAVREAMSKDKP
jgi:glutathione peroxidase-family protein